MMRRNLCALALIGLLAPAATNLAEIGTIDDVPAATLLLPYFEVDFDPMSKRTNTLFSINNASASATLAHVTFWTDESIPTLDFDIYLTGYDVVTVNLRDVFNGILPRTADDVRDPTDTISPQGPLSQDITFPNCAGRLPLPQPLPNPTIVAHLQAAHTGQLSPVFGACAGLDYGDGIARGYVTVDVVNSCSLLFPNSPGYFAAGGQGIAGNRNVLWGDYFYTDSPNDFAQGETLVHVEACDFPAVGQGADDCPFVAGDYTFYGRYVAGTAIDGREALPTTFVNRFLLGALFDAGTQLVVWRDSKTTPTGANGAHPCGGTVAWFPLSQADAVAFDEAEDATDLCFQGDIVSPPIGGAGACFPAETQRLDVATSGVPGGEPLNPPYDFGWLFSNLNTNTAGVGGIFGDTAQGWVTAIMSAADRFSVGIDAIALDNALDTNPTAGALLIP
jgi:hypothetical protein